MAGRFYFYVLSVMLAALFIHAEEVENHARYARSLTMMPSITNCNYTTQPGWSCSGCNTVRICLPNNVAINTNCGLFLPYCDAGRCVFSPNASCNSTGSS
ncbi:unnamed protein product [Colias eurytheme]|nr:unnamed protein product [Colias eurytheme]